MLKAAGIQMKVQSFWSLASWTVLYRRGHLFVKIFGFLAGTARRIGTLFTLSQYDFVFIHRECLPLGPPVWEWTIAKVFGKKIIYDFDDAIWLPNTSEENSFSGFLKYNQKVASICSWSYKVSCGNNFLADYARQFNAHVVMNPTTVDTELLHNPALHEKGKPEKVTIGWTGTQSTLPYIISLLPVFDVLHNKYQNHFRLLIIANKEPDVSRPFMEFIPWNKKNEVADLCTIDIGVMPLTDDDWSKGKCGFKALQYMALEIGTVASAVGVNAEIIDHEVSGFLCRTEKDWVNCLERLMSNPELRKSIGIKGRQKVISHYSVSSNTSNFLDLFS